MSYTKEQIEQYFQVVFNDQKHIDETESAACIFKPNDYIIVDIDFENQKVIYKVKELTIFGNEKDGYEFKERITFQDLVAKYEAINK